MTTTLRDSRGPRDTSVLIDEQLCFALYSTMLGMSKVYRRVLKDLGITYPQYLVLLVLWEADQQTVSAIGQRLFLDSPTLTPLLKRMEASGHVVRTRSSEDERQVIVSLTVAGRALKSRARHVRSCVAAALDCTTGEIDALRDRLVALRANLLRDAA